MKRPRRPPSADRFEFDRNIIPKGRAYQWLAINVRGEKQDISRALSNGWKPVPFKRHAKIFGDANHKGRIIIDGLMLVEHAQSWVETNLAANTLDAQWADEQRKFGFFGSAGGIYLPEYFGHQLPVGGFHGGWSPPHTAPADFEVTITLRLSPRQLDAAESMGISPDEYARRVAKMIPLSLLVQSPRIYGDALAFPEKDKEKDSV